MIYKINLPNSSVNLIKIKIDALKLTDEQKQKLTKYDYIEITNETTKEKIYIKIIKLHKHKNIKESLPDFYTQDKCLEIKLELTSLYEIIKSDKYIIDIYNKIGEKEEIAKKWAYHNYNHAINVTMLVERILKSLNYNSKLIEGAMIASIMHDIGALEGKKDHATRSYERAKKYFDKNNIDFEYKEEVLEAIKLHSDGFNTNNIIALSLILADKLDIKSTRVCTGGYEIEGMRQLAHIKDIDIQIDSNILKVNFLVDNEIDIQELNNYYFTKKVFKAIESFANKLNLEYTILMNNKIWKIDKPISLVLTR